ITSVGSGSLIMVALLLLYPTLHAVKIVGTDLLQATPLVLAAAVSHIIVTGVDWAVLLPLIVGGVPGTALGARIASIVSQRVIRRGIVLVLTLTGLTLLGVPGQVVGILGAAFLLLGPVAWSLLLRSPMARARQSDSDGWGGCVGCRAQVQPRVRLATWTGARRGPEPGAISRRPPGRMTPGDRTP